MTAANVRGGGGSSDEPGQDPGAQRQDRLYHVPEGSEGTDVPSSVQRWADGGAPHVSPAESPAGGPAPYPGRETDAGWPAAGQGADGAPAQVFRPEAGLRPAVDEAETGATTAPAGRPPAPNVPPVPATPPMPQAPPSPPVPAGPEAPAPQAQASRERASAPGHGWDDGLIARRAPRAVAASGTIGETGTAAASGTTGETRGVAEPAAGTTRGAGTAAPAAGPGTEPHVHDHGRCPGEAHVHGADVHGSFPHVDRTHVGAGAGVGADGRPKESTCPDDAVPRVDDHAPEAAPGPHRSGIGDAAVHRVDRTQHVPVRPPGTGGLPSPQGVGAGEVGGSLRRRLSALRELIGLSRTRLEGKVLAEAGQVLDEAGARAQLSAAYTTIALAGATGSGKSSLLNALAGRTLSETGLRRPTTAQPVACTWEAEREGGADGLLDRLGIAPTMRRRVKNAELHGLVLIDLPDHDSVATGHREHVDRLLQLVDAVVWVVDPEKYADAMLHERYLRPLAGYAEVTFVVLNQVDRLPGDAADAVLHDLRRLLDEDGMALGDYGEPGARVLATSALTGEGLGELREELGAFAATREAPARRLTADLDAAAERLRRVYADPALPVPAGLTEADREEFEDLLASAVGACAAGQAAERAWLRYAERSCGTPWSQLVRWRDARRRHRTGQPYPVADARGRPQTVRGQGAGETLSGTGFSPECGGLEPGRGGARVARPVLAQAVRQIADRAAVGLPDAWRRTVRNAAWRGAEGLPEALDSLVGEAAETAGSGTEGMDRLGQVRAARQRAGDDHVPARMPRPPWWTAGMLAQGLLLALQVVGVFLLAGAAFGAYRGAVWPPVVLVLGGALCAPALAAGCRAAARGPARAYGQEEERRLRRLSAGCGRTRVLEPVAGELLRYREVREQYVVAAGDDDRP